MLIRNHQFGKEQGYSVKKLISIILCIAMMMTVIVIPVSAQTTSDTVTVDDARPLVIVRGMDFITGLVRNPDTPEETTVGMDFSAKTIIKGLSNVFIQGITKFSKDAAVDALCDFAYDIFEDYACDKNGESLDKSVVCKTFDKNISNYTYLYSRGKGEETLAQTAAERYGEQKVFYFKYDWRLNPNYNASLLNDVINTALSENPECDKVNIVCCSMGGLVTLAYLTNYGSDKVHTVVSDTSVMYGTDVTGDLLQGKVVFEPDAAEQYLSYYLSGAKWFIHFLNKVGILDIICNSLNNFVDEYKDKIYDEVLIPIFGTNTAVWALVYNDEYEAAKQYIFGGKEDEYASFIEIIDDIQNNIVAKRDETLNTAMENGMNLTIIANYNRPDICVYESAALQGDGILGTNGCAFGATVSNVGDVLSDEQTVGVSDEYLSVDGCINAYTCKYADRTWFIRNARHVGCYYNSEYTFFVLWLIECEEQPTVYQNEKYPRFMISDKSENLYPLTLEKIGEIENSLSPVC